MVGPGRPGRIKGGKNRAPVGPFSKDRKLTTLELRARAPVACCARRASI